MRENNRIDLEVKPSVAATESLMDCFGDVINASQVAHSRVIDLVSNGVIAAIGTSRSSAGATNIIQASDAGGNTSNLVMTPTQNFTEMWNATCQVFPQIEQWDTTDTSLGPQIARNTDQAYIKFYDNRIKLKLVWDDYSVAQEHEQDYIKIHEVCYQVPDVTVIGATTVPGLAMDSATAANGIIRASTLYRWYNAKILPNPIASANTPTNVPDTFGTNSCATVAFEGITQLGPVRKQDIPTGIFDVRKECRVVWQRQKKYKRPKRLFQKTMTGTSAYSTGLPLTTNGNVATEDGADTTTASTAVQFHQAVPSMAPGEQIVRLGKKFNINKKMTWKSGTGTTFDVICPRGAYIYCAYIFFVTPLLADADWGSANKVATLDFRTVLPDRHPCFMWQQA